MVEALPVMVVVARLVCPVVVNAVMVVVANVEVPVTAKNPVVVALVMRDEVAKMF